MRADYHVHTTHCDGKSTAEETVLRAIGMGLSVIGFSGHGYTPHDVSYCMTQEKELAYRSELLSLREKYGDKIKILCGIERDVFGVAAPWADFTIGSVHYMKIEDEYVDVDESAEKLIAAADKYFGGDILSLCEVYFRTVSQVCEKTSPDIVGHFDLIAKFNERERLFDENHPRYAAAWQTAVDKLILKNVPFEINTGAMSRGYTSRPYPSDAQIKYIAARGGKFIMTSDCHAAENLCFEFDKWRAWAKNLGAEIIEHL